jgi:hypothetical protein
MKILHGVFMRLGQAGDPSSTKRKDVGTRPQRRRRRGSTAALKRGLNVEALSIVKN